MSAIRFRIALFLVVISATAARSASGIQTPLENSPPTTTRIPLASSPNDWLSPNLEDTRQSEFFGRSDVADQIQSQPDLLIPINPTDSSSRKFPDIPVSIGAIWMPGDETEILIVDTSFKFPILWGFGSPPPIVKTGFVYTSLEAPSIYGLPNVLHEYTIGVSKIYRVSERWTIRSMLGVALATDDENFSSDSWQFRGGVFGIYKANANWQYTIGAIALGRDDLPVVPALGAVWTPSPNIRWDLIPPNPRLNFKIFETGSRENWIYTGFGFNGKTWGYRKQSGTNDRLTYQDLRVVCGWQSRPQSDTGSPYVRGRKYNFEFGYTFSRYLEFDREATRQALNDAWLIQLSTTY